MSDENVMFLSLLIKAMNDGEPDYNSQDTKFVRDMIPHHEMAVKMADKQVSKGKNKAMLALAAAIKKAQTGEIAELKKWLAARELSGGAGHSM